ncbi:FxLD family lantipeptide [Actinomadura spongiicola]|uniref:FxLD family lantipeptide n=1 Tax=Actinomadura spongiicola TaxID=2303421 RepID=A0A372G7U1_9ACTN|nr:FxLD family lanthipeptide [Actinomadura spongiicola]RFS81445.1 FxLD family lantipeptide [Actinomadura spongiicola]
MVHGQTSGGATALAERPAEEDEFDLDVRVLVAYAPAARGNCPTDDGCGDTCSGNASACNSTFDDPS